MKFLKANDFFPLGSKRESMEKSLGLLSVLIATLFIIHLVQAQSQLGFISLDCGLPATEQSPYIELQTGLNYSSDATFIQSGEIGTIQPNLEGSFLKPYTKLRYFPYGTRNCYSLDVKKGRKYLIKAWFIYGNYDGLNINPNFDLYLGPNLWATVDMPQQAEEILHNPISNLLQICLVKTGETRPLISALELRPLENTTYITQSGSLKLLRRVYYNTSNTNLRYPGDAYDRQWFPRSLPWLTQISTSKNVSNSYKYNLPKALLENAATPTNVSLPLTIEWSSKSPDDQYYVYLHYAEIQDLQANETREFILLLNGEKFSEPTIPTKLQMTTIKSDYPRTCRGDKCSLQLTRTSRSTLPPLLSAYEIFKVIHFSQSETDEKDVAAIKSIKNTYELNRINWQGDPCVPKDLMWDGLTCSYKDNYTAPRITSLSLSSTGLTGTIAAAIQNLTELEKLDLSKNNLIGDLPEFLGNIKSLKFINVKGNDLNGSIPQTLMKKSIMLLYDGKDGNLIPGHHSSSSKKFVVKIVTPIICLVILITVLVIFLVLRKQKLPTVEAPLLRDCMATMRSDSPKPLIELKNKRFTHSEVIEMTNNFERLLGKGGFGNVYYGTLNDSEQVAVKVCKESSTINFKQFKAEVHLLFKVHHTNLVSLIGYCDEGDHLALIYEFLPNGHLKEHISGKQGRPILNWDMRLRIAVEASLGLEYLHTGCKMIHRDVKSTNILLTEQFQAKLADFGLSRSFPLAGETHVSTMTIAGSFGYIDPEYHDLGRLSEKSDVYSFGIMLLEMITNKLVIDETRKKPNIAEWVRFEYNQGEITSIIDPNIDQNSPSVHKALELAMSCADPSSKNRPTMSQVVSKLKECV